MPSREWEIKKLGELGQLTNESIEIIAFNTGQKSEAIKQAIAEALVKEVTPIDKTLQQAAKKGFIQGANIVLGAPESTQNVLANQSIITVLQNLTQQANEETNIVNTVMLDSVRNRYVQAINNTLVEEQKEIEKLQAAQDLATLNAQLEKTQTALNTSAFSVASGAEARTTALRRTIGQLAAEGITGYVDAGGHHWSPEAYINMDIRTTVHNAAIQGQKARSADYGVDTFQVSTHSGARPLCAPYQGKFYSWGGDSGTVYDIDGNAYKYESITTTSYGEAAGLFGINCGHFPQTFISGFSKPRFEPMEDEEENDRIYQESQEQRAIERDIRKWKTEALSYQAAGDQEGFEKAALKVKEKQADYRSFCKDTGRTPRNDRTQVFGYDRSTAAKASAAARNAEKADPTYEIKQRLMAQVNAWNGNSEPYKDAIINSISRADKKTLAAINRTIDNVYVDFIDADGTSEYRNGAGSFKLYTSRYGEVRDAEDVTNTFWHEYGHFYDDAWISKSGVVEKYNIGSSEFENYGVTQIIYGEKFSNAAADDINAFLKRSGLDNEFYMSVNEYGNRWLHYANGESVDFDTISFDDNDKLHRALSKWQKDLSGRTAANNYLYSQGMPRPVEYNDYYEAYRTPKRQTLKWRERYKGAEDAYHAANEAYYEAKEAFENTHDMQALYAEQRRLSKIADENEHKLGWVTDTFDAGAYGAFTSVVLGGHTRNYYTEQWHDIQEPVANVFMSTVVNDPVITNGMKDLCPNVYDLIKGVINAY